MDQKYTYSKDVNSGRLTKEIQRSAITTALDYIDTSPGNVDIYMKAVLSGDDETLLSSLVSSHVNTPLPIEAGGVYTADGTLLVDVGFHVGAPGTQSYTVLTHDYSDRTTWYQKSVQITDEVLSANESFTIYSASKQHWVNIQSQRLTIQYKCALRRDGTFVDKALWNVVVKVNDVVATTGYDIDFTNGTITFSSPLIESDVVKATFHHNDDVPLCSEFILRPATLKKMVVEHVELQFSKSITFTDIFRLEIWAGLDLEDFGSFPDVMYDAGYGQYRIDYRGMHDFINISNEGKGFIPACGGLTSDVLVFPFNYVQAITLLSSIGTLIRLRTINDLEIGTCEIASAAFYLEEMPE